MYKYSNCTGDRRPCFRYTNSTIPPLLISTISRCGCIGRFVSDLVGNPEDRFWFNMCNTNIFLFYVVHEIDVIVKVFISVPYLNFVTNASPCFTLMSYKINHERISYHYRCCYSCYNFPGIANIKVVHRISIQIWGDNPSCVVE